MALYGIQGKLLEVIVVGCSRLKDTELFSRQDPYVRLEYSSTVHTTKTDTDGGSFPIFNDKFVFSLIDGLGEIAVTVFNSNTIMNDDFIGSGKIQLQKVISTGFDDSSWPLQDQYGRHGGEVRVTMTYANANKLVSAQPYGGVAPVSYAPTSHRPPYTQPSHSTHALSHPQGYPSPTPYHQPQQSQAYSHPGVIPPPQHYPPSPYPHPPYGAPPTYPPGPHGSYPRPPY